MSLVKRKPRPLTRDGATFRDDRLFIVASDDRYAPKQYFEFFSIPRVHVHVIPTEDGTSSIQHVLGRLLEFEHEDDDQLWLLLDTDHHTGPNHIATFIQSIKEAKQKGVNVALSRPCFEFWLLLHHADSPDLHEKCGTVETALRKILGGYDKTELRKAHYPPESVLKACERARRLDTSNGEIPPGNASQVYLLWKAIIESAQPSQLPPEFKT